MPRFGRPRAGRAGRRWPPAPRPARPRGRGSRAGRRGGSGREGRGRRRWPASSAARVTVRRSARRTIVRASSSAALTRVSPGTTNSRGQLDRAPRPRAAARPARRPSPRDTRVTPSCWLVARVGVGRQLRADHEQLALEAQDQRRPGRRGSATGRRTAPSRRARRGRGRAPRRPRRPCRRPRCAGRPCGCGRRRTGARWCRRRRVPVATADCRIESVGARHRAVGAHHIRPASRGSQRSASRVTLTACSTTLSACSLTCCDHRAGVGAERGREDHLDLGRVRAEDDLLDQGELDDVHPDLGVDDGAQRVEDRELGGAALGVERRGRCVSGPWRAACRSSCGNPSTGLGNGRHAGIGPSGARIVRRVRGTLTTTPGTRSRSGRAAASSSVKPGPASEPSASKNSAYRSRWAAA